MEQKLTPIERKEFREGMERGFQEIVVWERVREMNRKPTDEDRLAVVRDLLRKEQYGER